MKAIINIGAHGHSRGRPTTGLSAAAEVATTTITRKNIDAPPSPTATEGSAINW